VVTRVVNGSAVPGVLVELSGTASATATTDATGHYRFEGLRNGTYSVSVNLAGQVSVPPVQAVTISGAGVAGADLLLLGDSTLASGIRFLPDTFLSTDQLRASLVVAGDDLLFTDSSDTPIKKLSAGGTAATALASRFGAAESVVPRGPYAYWVDGGRLNRTSLDGRITTVLASGTRDLVAGSRPTSSSTTPTSSGSTRSAASAAARPAPGSSSASRSAEARRSRWRR